jgi:hypothetical protein
MANRRFIDFPIASSVGDSDIVLIWQDGMNKQTTKGTLIQGAPTSLEGLTDVDIAGLINGQILQYNSTTGKWENVDRTDINLSELGDVSIVSPTNGQVLVYNSSTSKWENSSGGYVPYTGAVTTVDLGAQGLRAGYIRFDTSVTSVPDEQGLMYWDASRSTAALIMNGVLQHIGQDTFFYVKNSTGSSIAKGTSVRFDGTDGASGHLKIAPFLANGTYPSNYFVGVTAETIANGAFGQVMHFGELDGINTSAYTAGALLYASTTVAGGFQSTAPVAPNNIVLIAAAINSKNNGTILVRPTYGSNINTDEGVKITSGTTGDLLQLQAGGLWENKTLAQVIGSAYVPSTRTITINGTTQDLSANRTFNVGTVTSVGLSSATSGVTIGSTPVIGSGTITIAIATASGSQNGLLSSTDWTTFNNKQNALTNPVTGTGTTNYLPKFTGTSTIGNSQVFDAATGVGIGTTSVDSRLTVNGQVRVSDLTLQGFYQARTSDTAGAGVFGGSSFVLRNGATSEDLCFDVFNRSTFVWYTPVTIKNTGNLLVGTTTDNGARLQVNGFSRFDRGTLAFTLNPSYAGGNVYSQLQSTGDLALATGGDNNRVYINSSGNLGLGVTPSASTWPTFELIGGNTITSFNSASVPAMYLSSNAYYDGGFKYKISSLSAMTYAINANNGQFQWLTAPSGTAGNAITFTQAMTLTSGGNLLVGTTTDAGFKLNVNGNSKIFGYLTLDRTSISNVNGVDFLTAGAGNWYIGSSAVGGNTDLQFYNYSANRVVMNISNTSGNVGIGTSSPANLLHLTGAVATPSLRLGSTSLSFYWDIGRENLTTGDFVFNNASGGASSERMRITAGGNVLIGTTTDAGFRLDVNGTGRFSGNVAIQSGSNAQALQLYNRALDNVYSGIYFKTNDGVTDQSVILNERIGTNGANLLFYTKADGGGLTERMRITSGGYLKASNTGNYFNSSQGYHELRSNNASSAVAIIQHTGSDAYGIYLNFTTSPNNTTNYFIQGDDSVNTKFFIYSNGNMVNRNGSYGTISDVKFKENIIDAKPKLTDILKLKVRNFNFKGDSTKQLGFIAQEFEEIFPAMVDTSLDRITKEKYKSIKTSVLVPMLVKAIQELKQEIDTLKN